MPSPVRWLQIWYADGRKDAHGSFHDVFDDAFDLEDLAKQYEATEKEVTSRGITTSWHLAAVLKIAGDAYKTEYDQLEREGTLREEWDDQNDDVIEEMVEDGVNPDDAFAKYQQGYREISVQLLADDILERHAEMVEDGDFGDEDEDEEEAEGEEAEA